MVSEDYLLDLAKTAPHPSSKVAGGVRVSFSGSNK